MRLNVNPPIGGGVVERESKERQKLPALTSLGDPRFLGELLVVADALIERRHRLHTCKNKTETGRDR